MQGKLGGDKARAADSNWPKGYSMPYDGTFSIEAGGVGWGQRSLFGDGLSIVNRVVSNCMVYHLFCIYYYYYYYYYLFFAFLLNCLYLNSQVFFTFFSHSPPHATEGGGE